MPSVKCEIYRSSDDERFERVLSVVARSSGALALRVLLCACVCVYVCVCVRVRTCICVCVRIIKRLFNMKIETATKRR